MRMDEAVVDEASVREAEDMGVADEVATETHAAKWARPRVEPFDPKDKALTFQVSFELGVLTCVRWEICDPGNILNGLHGAAECPSSMAVHIERRQRTCAV